MNTDIESVTATVNGEHSQALTALLTKSLKGDRVTDLEKNEALTRKLDKLKDKLEADYIKEIDKMSNEELKKKVLGYAQEVERIDDEKTNDKTLNAAKSTKSTLEKGYRDTKKATTTRMQFVLAIMQSRGVKVV